MTSDILVKCLNDDKSPSESMDGFHQKGTSLLLRVLVTPSTRYSVLVRVLRININFALKPVGRTCLQDGFLS